jgi:hypothetical protein
MLHLHCAAAAAAVPFSANREFPCFTTFYSYSPLVL